MTQLPEMEVTKGRASIWRNLSPVWLVPLLALAVSLGIAWRSYMERGVLVQITFQNAAGISPGETSVRLRDVPIGHVESVSFAPDLASVLVAARIDRTVAEVLPADAEFWVVRPEVSARGITGLTTVLSGVYIETAFSPDPAAGARIFNGRESAPLVPPGRQGQRITLRAPDGNRLTPGAPVLYRGIEVGHIESPRLVDEAEGVVFDAFIESPHDRRLTTATRFWDTSGFSVSLGAGGVRLDVGNLASILTGGIAFDTVFSGGDPLDQDTVFDLFVDEATARASVVTGVGSNALRLAVEFEGSVQGLSAGAVVRYRGIRVGEVTGIGARVVDPDDTPTVRMWASLAIDPQAMGLGQRAQAQDLLTFLETRVARFGLRARLATTGLFGGTLMVELVELSDVEPATLRHRERLPSVLPSVHADLPDLNATAEGLLGRINALPIEELLQQATSLMATVEALVGAEETRAVPGTVVALIDDARALIGSDALQGLPAELSRTVSEFQEILIALREEQAAARLVAALESINAAADNIAGATAEFPALTDDLRTLVGRASELELDMLVEAATRLIESADQLISAEDTRALPPALSGALAEVQAALTELREGGAVANVNQTLLSARSAADAVAVAAADLPTLAGRLDDLVVQAEGLVAAYGARSPVNDEMLNTLREARTAARAFAQLARTLERSPNSILFGR